MFTATKEFFDSRVKMTRVSPIPGSRLFVDLYRHRTSSLVLPRSFKAGPPTLTNTKRLVLQSAEDLNAPRYTGVVLQFPILPHGVRATPSSAVIIIDSLLVELAACVPIDVTHHVVIRAELFRALTGRAYSDPLPVLSRGAGRGLLMAHLGGAVQQGSYIALDAGNSGFFGPNEFFTTFVYREAQLLSPVELSGEFSMSDPFASAPKWTRHEDVAGLTDNRTIVGSFFLTCSWLRGRSKTPQVVSQAQRTQLVDTLTQAAAQGATYYHTIDDSIWTYRLPATTITRPGAELLVEDETHLAISQLTSTCVADAVWALALPE